MKHWPVAGELRIFTGYKYIQYGPCTVQYVALFFKLKSFSSYENGISLYFIFTFTNFFAFFTYEMMPFFHDFFSKHK